MKIKTIASDGKKFEVGGKNFFKGCLGIAVTISEDSEDNIKEKYHGLIDSLLSDADIERILPVYKSYDIGKIFEDKFLDALEKLFTGFLEIDGLEINIFYSTFNTSIMPKVKYYGKGGSAVVEKNTLQFIEDLSGYYPYVCIWKLSKGYQLKGCNIFIDHFQGELTEGWNELQHQYHDINVVLKGDMVNEYISMADLITRFIEKKLKDSHKRLSEDGILEILKEYKIDSNSEKVNIWYIGKKDDLDYTVPKYKRKINLHRCLNVPTIFILKEGLIKQESKWIENSPHVYNKIRKFAHSVNAGFTFIEYAEDYKYIREDDYIMYLGDEGK
ncbi:MAG: hypothetical protein U9O96_06335, partial [Candidatus Thermoplasmatota archaeon]|nr:hypothetical protein [Candidatus Thermoplasmatota archaeon]